MIRPNEVRLGDGTKIPILYEDRSVLAMDKPAGWMLVPHSWQRTTRNLQAAIVSSIAAGQFWARSRNLRFLRYVHRLDAETTGVMLFAKSAGGVEAYGQLFESRRMDKRYLVVVQGVPRESKWTCRWSLGPDPKQIGRVRVDPQHGKPAETHFKLLQTSGDLALLEALPWTGRTHQIRVHLAAAGHPVAGDPLYGLARTPEPGAKMKVRAPAGLGLRAVFLAYRDPFTRKQVEIRAPAEEFLRRFEFETTFIS